MANRKLTELPTLSPINFDSMDLLYIVDVQTDISKKIPYSLLAGDSLITLSAYDSQNTLNVDYLSGSIDINTAAIATLDAGEIGLTSDIDYLSGKIDSNFSFLSGENDTKADKTQVNLLSSDVLILSGQLGSIESDSKDSFTKAESINQGTLSLTASDDTITSIDLGLETTDSPAFAGLTVNGVNVPSQINTNTSYVSQVSVTPTGTTSLTATHYVNVNLGGTNYKLLLSNMT
jgi:hypothetical protein